MIEPCEKCLYNKNCQFLANHSGKNMIGCTAYQDNTVFCKNSDVFECIDRFRDELMNMFIALCRGNDYNKLTLLKIDDVVCKVYDKQIAELNKKYTEENEV